MSDALLISAVLLFFIALWGIIVFILGWKQSPDRPAGNRWRRFWIVVFALCGLALLVSATVRTSVPRNAAIADATQMALQSPSVTAALGTPIRTTGLAYGGYRGFGEGSRVSAGLRLKGPLMFALLNACGIRHQGEWQLLYADVVAGNRSTIPLTHGSQNPCRP